MSSTIDDFYDFYKDVVTNASTEDSKYRAIKRRKTMTSEQYRTYLIESIKIGAQMMHDMAEDIAGKSDAISNLTVTINFDPGACSVPELTIERSHFPNHDQMNQLLDIRQKAKYVTFLDEEETKSDK